MTTADRTDGDGLDHFSIDWALEQLCAVLGVRTNDVIWDAATETVDGDVRAVIGNILRVKYGENWSAAAPDTGEGTLAQSIQFGWRWRDALLAGSPDWHIGLSPPAGFKNSERWIVEPLYAAPPKPAPDHADDFGDMPSAYLAARSSPPKPDRETLIHTICPHIRQYSDSHWQGNHACLQCPATVKISQGDAVQRCRRDAEEAADDVIRCWQSTGDQPTPQVSASALARMTEALEFIRDGYANQDVNHVDYRVKVYQVALDALGDAAADRTPAVVLQERSTPGD